MREQIQQAIDLRDAVVTCFISGDGGELGCDVDRLYDLIDAALRRAKAEAKEYAWDEAAMRAACAAHRACCGVEADNAQGKIHGCCVVCGVPWPCETAQFFLFKADARAAQIEEGEDLK